MGLRSKSANHGPHDADTSVRAGFRTVVTRCANMQEEHEQPMVYPLVIDSRLIRNLAAARKFFDSDNADSRRFTEVRRTLNFKRDLLTNLDRRRRHWASCASARVFT
jgi:hypothetical protein